MNLQLQQLFDARMMSQWQYRQSLMLLVVAKVGMALVFGILLLGMLLTG
jgi:hypothetical protein